MLQLANTNDDRTAQRLNNNLRVSFRLSVSPVQRQTQQSDYLQAEDRRHVSFTHTSTQV